MNNEEQRAWVAEQIKETTQKLDELKSISRKLLNGKHVSRVDDERPDLVTLKS